MNIYKRRYVNALKKAAKINRFKEAGYLVLYEGALTDGKFVLEDQRIVFRISPQVGYTFFINDKAYDKGIYTKIYKYNQHLNNVFTILEPIEDEIEI